MTPDRIAEMAEELAKLLNLNHIMTGTAPAVGDYQFIGDSGVALIRAALDTATAEGRRQEREDISKLAAERASMYEVGSLQWAAMMSFVRQLLPTEPQP